MTDPRTAPTDALPLPPPPQPRPRPIARTPDIPPDLVQSRIRSMMRDAAGGDGVNMYNAVPSQPLNPAFRPFDASGGTDPLHHIESVLTEGTGNDPSTMGFIKDMAHILSTPWGRPVRTITDLLPSWLGGRLDAIEKKQAAFLQNHAWDLTALSETLSDAFAAMGRLTVLLDAFKSEMKPINDIMREKKSLGRALRDEIAAALADSDDPEERGQLQAQKDDMDAWLLDCDARLGRDQSLVGSQPEKLPEAIDAAYSAIEKITAARIAEAPSNMTSSGRIVETTHTRPDAARYVQGLAGFLVQLRVQMNGAIMQ